MEKIIFIIPFLIITSCNKIVIHDVEKAIDSCNIFIESVMKEDYQKSYDCISEKLQKEIRRERFVNILKQNTKLRGKIKKAEFDSYQHVFRERALQLYYYIYHEKVGKTLYHFVLEGDRNIEYEVFFIDIGNKIKYPPGIKIIKEYQRKKISKKIVIQGEQY